MRRLVLRAVVFACVSLFVCEVFGQFASVETIDSNVDVRDSFPLLVKSPHHADGMFLAATANRETSRGADSFFPGAATLQRPPKSPGVFPCPNECQCRLEEFSLCRTITVCKFVSYERVNLTDILMNMSKDTCRLTMAHSTLPILPSDFLHEFNKIVDMKFENMSIFNLDEFLNALSTARKSSLRDIDFSNNRIENISATCFEDFSNLKTLDLRSNRITSLDNGAFQNLTRLQILNLDNNLLTFLPPELFKDQNALVELHLNNNRLTRISPGTLKFASSLRDLLLANNLFEELTESMIDAPSLCQIYMMSNKIRTIQSAAIPLLRKHPNVYLNNNQLESLPEAFFDDDDQYVPFRRLAKQFDGNPWSCNCSSRVFISLLKRNSERDAVICQDDPRSADSVANLLCGSPAGLKGKPLINLSWLELSCGQTRVEGELCDHRLEMAANKEECRSLRHKLNCSVGQNLASCVCNPKRTNCFVCPSGSYGPHKSNGTICALCPQFHTSQYGATSIKECHCAPGFQPGTSNVTECTECPMNFFKSHTGSHPCSPCPAGSVTLHTAAHRCQCLPGYTLGGKDDSCHMCPENTYKQRYGNDVCQPCFNSCSSNPGSVTPAACINCTGVEMTEQREGLRCRAHIAWCDFKRTDVSFLSQSTKIDSTTAVPTIEFDQWTVVIVVVAVCVGALIFIITSIILHRILRKAGTKNNYKEAKTIINSNYQRSPAITSLMTENISYSQQFSNDKSLNGLRIELNQIRFDKLLGQGAFGQVHSALVTGLNSSQHNPIIVAVKSLRDGHSYEEKEALRTELQQLFYVGQHPNIINLLGFVNSDDNLMLIIEHAAHGDLLSYLKDKVMNTAYAHIQFNAGDSIPTDIDVELSSYLRPNDGLAPATIPLLASENHKASPRHSTDKYGNMDERQLQQLPTDSKTIDQSTLLSISWQVAKGMSHLARMKCIHRDLAARNVLLSEGLVAKVSDFGLARAVYESGYYFKETKGRLPFKWMPPEAILEGQYTTKSDVWSLGILLWELFTLGGNPYPGVPINSLLDLIRSGYRMAKPNNCPPEVYSVMQSCWSERPCDRPSFDSLSESLDKLLQRIANKDYLELINGKEMIDRNNETNVTSDLQHNAPQDCVLHNCLIEKPYYNSLPAPTS